jgi:hypothetical protein
VVGADRVAGNNHRDPLALQAAVGVAAVVRVAHNNRQVPEVGQGGRHNILPTPPKHPRPRYVMRDATLYGLSGTEFHAT